LPTGKPLLRQKMHTLRLLADDLTGALDTAAEFAGVFGPVPVAWRVPVPHDNRHTQKASLAIDSATRELSPAAAGARCSMLAPLLAPRAGTLSFFKLDSLLRGHAGRELTAILAHETGFRHIVIAPAVPFQGRITRNGRQHIRDGAGWVATGEDMSATLQDAGIACTHSRPGEAIPDGVSLWDCPDDAGLRIIAEAGLALVGPVLWVGATGLAAALAALLGKDHEPPFLPDEPILGLIGSEHPMMRAQMQRIPRHSLAISTGDAETGAAVNARLMRDGAVFLTCDLPGGLDRHAARAEITTIFDTLLAHCARPGLLFASGGETLRGLCEALGAEGLEALGQYEPGAPLSRLTGGRWHGLPLLSKSGAFGEPDFLASLLDTLTSARTSSRKASQT
jgi:uncharacterized protein YgbK (DUF1537 family)